MNDPLTRKLPDQCAVVLHAPLRTTSERNISRRFSVRVHGSRYRYLDAPAVNRYFFMVRWEYQYLDAPMVKRGTLCKQTKRKWHARMYELEEPHMCSMSAHDRGA